MKNPIKRFATPYQGAARSGGQQSILHYAEPPQKPKWLREETLKFLDFLQYIGVLAFFYLQNKWRVMFRYCKGHSVGGLDEPLHTRLT